MTLWSRFGWLALELTKSNGRVHLTMGHPDWPHLRYINAPDMSMAVAWAMILRTGTVHWRPKCKPSTSQPLAP